MKIRNATKYPTAQLRAFVSPLAAKELDAAQRKRLLVKFAPARQQRGVTGHSDTWRVIWIHVPTRREMDDALKVDLAATIAHELHHIHCGGRSASRSWELSHYKSIPYGMAWKLSEEDREAQRQLYAWAIALPLAIAEPVATPRKSAEQKASEKREAIALRLAEWEARARRCKNAIAKYRTRLRYYDRRLAAMKAPKARTIADDLRDLAEIGCAA